MRFGHDRPWRSFRAEQAIDARDLGFRWNARMRLAALVVARATDAFEAGHGRLEVRVAGVRVMRSVGPDTDVGELLRLLAELPLCPLAYDHPALEWSADGEGTLRVAAEVGGTRASVALQVDDAGRVVGCRAERPRLVGRRSVPTPWRGRLHEYREMGGVRIPARLEVAWELPEGELTYFRGEILDLRVIEEPAT
jgi:hypothetical protein